MTSRTIGFMLLEPLVLKATGAGQHPLEPVDVEMDWKLSEDGRTGTVTVSWKQPHIEFATPPKVLKIVDSDQ